MTSNSNPPWLPKERKITDDDWNSFREQYIAELGFDEEPTLSDFRDTEIFERVPAFRHDNNWHLLMPPNSITRMKEAKHPYEVFKEVVQETAENALGETEPQPNDLYFIAEKVITRYKGSTDFRVSAVHSGDFKPHSERGNHVSDEMTIIVTNTNSRNLENWYVYVFEDAEELFGPTLYSMTQAARSIYEAELDPDQVLRDVAFTLEDGGLKAQSVSGVTPPQHPVSIVSIEHYDGYYNEVESPQTIFGDDWGDVDSMERRLADEGLEAQRIGSAPVGFWVVTGVNW